jgi:hypothetical protein
MGISTFERSGLMEAGPSIQAGRGLIWTPGFKARRKGSKVPPAGIESSTARAGEVTKSKHTNATTPNERDRFDNLGWFVAVIMETRFAFALRRREHNLIPLRS